MASAHAHRSVGTQAWLGLATAIAVFLASLFFWSEAHADPAAFTARTSLQSTPPTGAVHPDKLTTQATASNGPAPTAPTLTASRPPAPGLPVQLAGGVIMLAALIWLIASRERRLW